MGKANIYKRAEICCYLECSCVDITEHKHNQLMKGARIANKKRAAKVAILAGVISKEDAKLYNPFDSYLTKTHVIYRHSAIEYFIKVN